MLKESQIENALLEYFNASGYVAFKNYDQAQFRDGSYIKHKWQMRGVADISLLTPLGVVYVEVKTPEGKQSIYQIRFEEKCKANGITYVVCRSILDGKNLVKNLRQVEQSRKA